MSKKALGKGLGALFSNLEYSSCGEILVIPINLIIPNESQPRKYFDEEKLAGLAESIKEKGVIQPICARKSEQGYIIIAGERRWRAAQLAGLKEIPVIIKNVSDREEFELALIENVQREDINPIEEGEAYRRLVEEFDYTQDKIALMVGKDKSTVSNVLRLLNLDESIKENVKQGLLSMGHARALLSVQDLQTRLVICKKVIEKSLSVRQIEKLVKKDEQVCKKKMSRREKADIYIQDMEDDLKSILSTYVTIKNKKTSGKIEIKYSSLEDLERIISVIKSEGI